MNDHATQTERAFRFGFTAGVAAAATRLTMSQTELDAIERWHRNLQTWRDQPDPRWYERWPDIDGGATDATNQDSA